MGYAIELLFEDRFTEAIIDIWKKYNVNGFGIDLVEFGSKPHIALSVYDETTNTKSIQEITQTFAEQIPTFNVELDGYGTFNTKEGVVFVKIRKTDILNRYHELLHGLSIGKKLVSNSYYTPGTWIPHCTLGINIEDKDISNALNCASEFKLPSIARVVKASAIRFRPIENLCDYGLQRFQPKLNQLLGNQVFIKIDRKINSKHPKHGFTYACNYGYVPETKNEDGKEVDAYLLGVNEPVDEFEGKCIAVLHRYDDYDDKLIVVPSGISFTDQEIGRMVDFQEQYFKSEIIREEGARKDQNLKTSPNTEYSIGNVP